MVQHVAGCIACACLVQVEGVFVSSGVIRLALPRQAVRILLLLEIELSLGHLVFPLLLRVALVPIIGGHRHIARRLDPVPHVVPEVVVLVPGLGALAAQKTQLVVVVCQVAPVGRAVQRLGGPHPGKRGQQAVLFVLVFGQGLAAQAGHRTCNAFQRRCLVLPGHTVGVAAAVSARQGCSRCLCVLGALRGCIRCLLPVLLVGLRQCAPIVAAANLPGQGVHGLLVPALVGRRGLLAPCPLFLLCLVLSFQCIK